jgi:hypothetical protein
MTLLPGTVGDFGLHQAPPGMIQCLRAVPPVMGSTHVSSTLMKALSCEWVVALRGPGDILVGRAKIARHVITRILNPRLLS